MPTVTAKATGLLLRWTAPSQVSVKEYWVYARNDGNTAVTTAHIVAKLGYGTDTFFYPYDNFNESSNITFHLKAISWAGKSSALSAILCADTTTIVPRFGNTASYTQIGDSGQVTFVGGAKHSKIYCLPLDSLGKGSVKPTEAILGTFSGYAYGIGDDSKFDFLLPWNYAVGTDISLCAVQYVNEDYATNSAHVSWQLDYACVPTSGGETIDSPTHTGTLLSGAVAIPSSARNTQVLSVVLTASDVSPGDVIGISFSRIANAGGEGNPGVEPVLINFGFHYEINKLEEI